MIHFSFPPVEGEVTGSGTGGGYFFDPMPLEEWSTAHTTGNLFIARKADGSIGDKSLAVALRDQMRDVEMKPYEENPLRMIMLQYIEAHTGELTNLQQSRIYVAAHGDVGAGYHWVDTFGHEGNALNLSAHSIHELKDGNETLHDIDLLQTDMGHAKASIAGNTHDLRQLGIELTKGDLKLTGVEDDLKYEIDCAKVISHFSSTDGSVAITADTTDGCKIDLSTAALRLKTTEGALVPINSIEADENISIVSTDGNAKIKGFCRLEAFNKAGASIGKFDKIKGNGLSVTGDTLTLEDHNITANEVYDVIDSSADVKATVVDSKLKLNINETWLPDVFISSVATDSNVAVSKETDGKIKLTAEAATTDYAFKGFFNNSSELPTTGVTPNESYAFVLSAEGAGSGTPPRAIPEMYIYQQGSGAGVKPAWYPQHVKGSLVCDYGSTTDKIIESIRFKGDSARVTESPSRYLNIDIPFVMDANFVGAFSNFNEMAHAIQTYKGKFVYKQTVGMVRTTNKPNDPRWDIVRWNKSDIEQPNQEQIRDESNWKRDTIGSKAGINAQIAGDTSINSITKIALGENVGEYQDSGKTLKIHGIEGSVGGNHKNIKSISVVHDSETPSNIDASTGALNIRIPKPSALTAQVSSNPVQPITNIAVSNRFGLIEDGTLKLPVISAENKDGTLLDEIKNIKAGDNVNFTTNNGVITINSTAAGSGTEADNKITVAGTDYQEAGTSIPVVQHVPKITFGEGLETEVVTTSGEETSVLIKALHTGIQAQAKGGEDKDKFTTITKIDVTGDAAYGSIEDGELTLNIQAPMCAAASKTELDSEFQPSFNPYRMAVTTNNEKFYYSNGSDWKSFGYVGMDGQVTSLDTRFPDVIAGNGAYNENAHKNLGYVHIPKTSATLAVVSGGIGLPVPEEGVIHNIYSTVGKWTQMFYGLEMGGIWQRTRENEVTWSEWRTINGMDESYFSLLTTQNETKFTSYHTGADPIPMLLLQDPRSNVKLDPNRGNPIVKRAGKYRITCILHLTRENDWPGHEAKFRFELRNEDDSLISSATPVERTISAGGVGEFHGKYPFIVGVFDNVELGNNAHVRWHTKMTMESSNVDDSELDPYKNFMLIEPMSTETRTTGYEIMSTYKETMGGWTFDEGYEVHVEHSTDLTASPRLFSARYNKQEIKLDPIS